MKTKAYNAEYFIKKFKKIHSGMWRVGGYGTHGGPRCAVGHCFSESQIESIEFRALFHRYLKVSPTAINDGLHTAFQQKYPKDRILAALDKIKEFDRD